MKKMCSIGGATQDIFMLYEGAETLHLFLKNKEHAYLILEQGTKIDIPSLHYATGGGATNAAVSLKRMGLDVTPYFKVGEDVAGTFIRQNLLKEHLDLRRCIVDPNASSAISFIVPSIEHNHVALCYRGANTQLTTDEFPEKLIYESDYIYVSPLSGGSRDLLPFITTKTREHKKIVAVNPGLAQLVDPQGSLYTALASIDILVMNAFEASHLMRNLLTKSLFKSEHKTYNSSSDMPKLLTHFTMMNDNKYTLVDYFHLLFKQGPSIAVVTNGAEGVYVATHETVYFHQSLKTAHLYALGAGDAFSSAFVGSLALGKTIEQATINGVLNSNSVIQFADAKEGLLTATELEERAKKLGQGLLKKYAL